MSYKLEFTYKRIGPLHLLKMNQVNGAINPRDDFNKLFRSIAFHDYEKIEEVSAKMREHHAIYKEYVDSAGLWFYIRFTGIYWLFIQEYQSHMNNYIFDNILRFLRAPECARRFLAHYPKY